MAAVPTCPVHLVRSENKRTGAGSRPYLEITMSEILAVENALDAERARDQALT